MKHAIFLRTYDNDLKWLKLSLPTILKNCQGFSCIRVVSDHTGLLALDYARSLGVETEYDYNTIDITDGYIAQQATKMRADLFLPADIDKVLFFDSDSLVKSVLHPEDYMVGDRIIYLITPWRAVGDAKEAWKKITEALLGQETEFEFMRRLPMAYNLSTIRESRLWLEEKSEQPLCKFMALLPRCSEYNFLGAWAHRFEPDAYHWINTLKGSWPQLPVRQFWSLGNMEEAASLHKNIIGEN